MGRGIPVHGSSTTGLWLLLGAPAPSFTQSSEKPVLYPPSSPKQLLIAWMCVGLTGAKFVNGSWLLVGPPSCVMDLKGTSCLLEKPSAAVHRCCPGRHQPWVLPGLHFFLCKKSKFGISDVQDSFGLENYVIFFWLVLWEFWTWSDDAYCVHYVPYHVGLTP